MLYGIPAVVFYLVCNAYKAEALSAFCDIDKGAAFFGELFCLGSKLCPVFFRKYSAGADRNRSAVFQFTGNADACHALKL